MIVTTKHGEFDCKDITRKERRELHKQTKLVFQSGEIAELHDLADKFAEIAFENPDEILGKLTAVEEDAVLMEIIGSYMGIKLGNTSGD